MRGLCRGLIRRIKAPKYITIRIFLFSSSIAFISAPTFPLETDFPLLHFYTTTIWFCNFHYYLNLCNHIVIPYKNVFPTISFPYGFQSEIKFPLWNYQVETRRFKTIQILFRLVFFQSEFSNILSHLVNNLTSHNLLCHHSSLLSYLINFPKSLATISTLFVILFL